MTKLLPEQTEALRQLTELWHDTPFVLIGATALALQMDLHWRQTNDLDLVVPIALKDYPAGLRDLPGWRRRRDEHAWRSATEINVDIIPAGPALLNAGTLTWPETGYEMNLVGLRLAFEHNVRMSIDEQHSVAVAKIPAIVVLKMVAYLDRPAEREDDLSDIAQVLEQYLGPTDNRRWDLPTHFEDASAFAVGADVGTIINEPERRLVIEFSMVTLT